MSDDQLEKWIIQRERESDYRSRIIPASTDRLASTDPGDGEVAMETIAAWLGEHDQLPLVELGRIFPGAITLTFSEEAILPEPWVSAAGDPYLAHDQWGITLQDALDLPRSDQYGWQVAGLTGLGTLTDGSRGLVNTCRWEILQIAGTPAWTRNLMLTQVMNQAAEPWSVEHDLWLIGFEETAEKLMSFLAKEHPRHRFHTALSLQELAASDLQGTTATLYVMGADRETELQFQALQTSGIGLVVDSVITDEAMFLTERDGGQAVLGPFRQNLELWPNLSPELIEKMEQAWLVTAELAKQKAAETDFNAFLTQQVHEASGDPQEQADLGLTDEIHPSENVVETEVSSESADQENELDSVVNTQGQVATAEPDDLAEDTLAESEGVLPENTVGENQEISLQILGKPTVKTPKGELTGRHAALLTILKLAQDPVPPQHISELLWPGDETQGQTARTRRSRLLAKVREHLGDLVEMEDGDWTLQQDVLRSDYDLLLTAINDTPITKTDTLLRACQKVTRPLEVAETWAEPYRATVTTELSKALSGLKDRAVEAEEFDIAKAVKSALRQLGEA